MATSKQVGNQATNSKRVTTSNLKLANEFENDHTKELILTKSEKEILIKAAGILSKIGTKKSKTEKVKKSEKLQRQKLTDELKVSATTILNNWSKPITIQDKIAYIYACSNSTPLRNYIEKGFPIGSSEVDSNDWLNMLNLLLEATMKEIPENIAFIQQSIKNEKTLNENMDLLKEKIEVTKNHAAFKNIVKQWTSKIELTIEK